MPESTIAVFVQIDAPGRSPGVHWQASLYLDDGGVLTYPVAVAWVSDFGPGACLGPGIDFIMVPDHYRRRGYAKVLIRECEKHWSDLWLTDAISAEGERLYESVEREENVDG